MSANRLFLWGFVTVILPCFILGQELGAKRAGLPVASNLPPPAEATSSTPAPRKDTFSRRHPSIEVRFERTTNRESQHVAEVLERSTIFTDAAESLSVSARLQRPMTVIFEDCRQLAASYDSARARVTLCYELFSHFRAILAANDAASEQSVRSDLVHSAVVVFFHEVGHALVSALSIPGGTNQEERVDEIVMLFLASDRSRDWSQVLAALLGFARRSSELEAGFGDLPFWDEHAFDPQRMYLQACLIYGSDSEKFREFAVRFPPEWAGRCAEEYRQKAENWSAVLQRTPEG